MKQIVIFSVVTLAGIAPVQAHNPICECFDNADGTITCEGGFSDGAPAAGVPLRVIASNGRVLVDGAMSEHSEFTFDKPDVRFRVEFDAGEGHIIQIDGRDIEE
ncbi:MAG: hypothetical protein PVF63_06560 [Gammaproteobacteria bacterium]|jgi:hypothetical protein